MGELFLEGPGLLAKGVPLPDADCVKISAFGLEGLEAWTLIEAEVRDAADSPDAVLDTPEPATEDWSRARPPGRSRHVHEPPVGDRIEKRLTSTTLPLRDIRRHRKRLAGASWMAANGDPDKPRSRRSSTLPVDDAEVRHCMITARQD